MRLVNFTTKGGVTGVITFDNLTPTQQYSLFKRNKYRTTQYYLEWMLT